MRKMFALIAGMVFASAMVNIAYSGVPQRIKYSGVLRERGVTFNGEKNIQYKIYRDLTGGDAVWVSSKQAVNINEGNFICTIELANINWNNGPYYLEMCIGETVLTPREEITSTIYALHARDIDDGKITTAKLADNAVTSSKIADDSITDVKVSSISWNKIYGIPDNISNSKLVFANYVTTEAVNSAIINQLFDISASTIALKNYIDKIAFSTGMFISRVDDAVTETLNVETLKGVKKLKFADGTIQTTAYLGKGKEIMLSSPPPPDTAAGDSLGSHIATMTLDMNNYGIINVSSITVSTTVAEGMITGFKIYTSSIQFNDGTIMTSTAIFGFGGGGPGGGPVGDNLGNHIATTTLNMANFNIINVSTLTAKIMSAATGYFDNIAASTRTLDAMKLDSSSATATYLFKLETATNSYKLGGFTYDHYYSTTGDIYNSGFRIYSSSIQFDDGTIMTSTAIFGFGPGGGGGGPFGDNLGTHVATTTLNMAGFNIIDVSGYNVSQQFIDIAASTNSIASSTGTLVMKSGDTMTGTLNVSTISALYQINSSTAVDFQADIKNTGFMIYTSTIQFADGTILYSAMMSSGPGGQGGGGDNLGNHIATMALNMNTQNIVNIGVNSYDILQQFGAIIDSTNSIEDLKLSKVDAAEIYLSTSGGTMSGPIYMGNYAISNATGNISMWTNDAGYVVESALFAEISSRTVADTAKLNRDGDTMSGELNVSTISALYQVNSDTVDFNANIYNSGFRIYSSSIQFDDGTILASTAIFGFGGGGGPGGVGDNLGDHIATTTLNMAGNNIVNASTISISNGGFSVIGDNGGVPVSGAGTRLMWIPSKAAFRAGYVDDGQWDDSNIGDWSFAAGSNTTASNSYSVAFGASSQANGYASTVFGAGCDTTNNYAIAMGRDSRGLGQMSMAFGENVTASGQNSIAIGKGVSGGTQLENGISDTLMIGFDRTIPTLFVSSASVSVDNTSMTAGLNVSTINYVSKISFSDGTVMTSTAQFSNDGGAGDNLGNHIATMTMDMNHWGIINVSSITVSTTATQGMEVKGSIFNSGYRIFSSSIQFDDGTILTSTAIFSSSGVTGGYPGFGGDNLGNHIATMTLDMAGFNIINVTNITTQFADVAISTNTLRTNLDLKLDIASATVTYLFKNEQAIDSNKLDGLDSTAFATSADLSQVKQDTGTLRTDLNIEISSRIISDMTIGFATGTLDTNKLDKSSATATYVFKTGDTMTGTLAANAGLTVTSGENLTISTNVYVFGYTSSTMFYGDGSGLTNIFGIDINCRISTGIIQNQLTALDNEVAVDTNTLRNDLTFETTSSIAADLAIGVETGTLRGDFITLAVSTGTLLENTSATVTFLFKNERASDSDRLDGWHAASSGTAIVPITDGESGELDTAVIPCNILVASATWAGIAGMLGGHTSDYFLSTGTAADTYLAQDSATITYLQNSSATATYVFKSGDTITGALTVSSNVYNSGFMVYTSSIQFDDGSVLSSTVSLSSIADNLGNHIATTTLNMYNNSIINISSITNIGNVGIGTTSPDPGYKLQVEGGKSVFHGKVAIGSDVGGESSPSLLVKPVTAEDDYVLYVTTSSYNQGASLVVSTTGNVGIGTLAPNAKLAVDGDISNSGYRIFTSSIQFSDGSVLTSTVAFSSMAADNLGNHTATTTLNMAGNSIINVSSITVSSATFSGNLGIGTTAPVTLLEVSGSYGTGTNALTISNKSAAAVGNVAAIDFRLGNTFDGLPSTAKIQAVSENAGNRETALTLYTGAGTATYTEKARITSSGNVGIGTASPGAKLDCQSGSGGYGLRLGFGDTSKDWIFGNSFYDWGQSSKALNIGTLDTTTGQDIFFNTVNINDQSKAVVIKAGGKVGIGTTSPSEKLEVNGNVKVNGDLTVTGTATSSIASCIQMYDITIPDEERGSWYPTTAVSLSGGPYQKAIAFIEAFKIKGVYESDIGGIQIYYVSALLTNGGNSLQVKSDWNAIGEEDSDDNELTVRVLLIK